VIYIGVDQREPKSLQAAVNSLSMVSPEYAPILLDSEKLSDRGLLWRPQDRRGGIYDLISSAPCSTDFAISRFLTPILHQSGWALFVDSDVVFLRDVADLFDLADDSKAVMVVQHHNGHEAGAKMDGQVQQLYPRKNWSSVVLFNCDHPANERLTLADVNTRPGRWLHRFGWLADSEIGSLPGEWNWLVGVQERPQNPAIAHFTLGTPELKDGPYADLWWSAYDGRV
jgi:hypothetical protein